MQPQISQESVWLKRRHGLFNTLADLQNEDSSITLGMEIFTIHLLKKIRKISHIPTSVLEFLFNNVAGLQACNFIKKRLQHRSTIKSSLMYQNEIENLCAHFKTTKPSVKHYFPCVKCNLTERNSNVWEGLESTQRMH